jgi:hypothetical protein
MEKSGSSASAYSTSKVIPACSGVPNEAACEQCALRLVSSAVWSCPVSAVHVVLLPGIKEIVSIRACGITSHCTRLSYSIHIGNAEKAQKYTKRIRSSTYVLFSGSCYSRLMGLWNQRSFCCSRAVLERGRPLIDTHKGPKGVPKSVKACFIKSSHFSARPGISMNSKCVPLLL